MEYSFGIVEVFKCMGAVLVLVVLLGLIVLFEKVEQASLDDWNKRHK